MTRRARGERPSIESALAPHVDRAWAEALILELRMQGVDGALIGEVLTEVESHCVESGNPAQHVFGDAVTYARSLDLPVAEHQTATTSMLSAIAPTAVQVLGLIMLGAGFASWRQGELFDVTVGTVVSVLLLLAFLALLARFSEPVVRAVFQRPVLTVLTVMVLGPAAMLPMFFLDAVLGRLPAGPVTVVGAAALLAGAGWELARHRHGTVEDPITSPLEQEPPARPRIARVVQNSPVLMILGSAVLMVVVTWWATA